MRGVDILLPQFKKEADNSDKYSDRNIQILFNWRALLNSRKDFRPEKNIYMQKIHNQFLVILKVKNILGFPRLRNTLNKFNNDDDDDDDSRHLTFPDGIA